MCVVSNTEITPESTATLPIHFGLRKGDTWGRNSQYKYYYRTGAKKNSGSPRGGCNFYCFLHPATDRIAYWNRGGATPLYYILLIGVLLSDFSCQYVFIHSYLLVIVILSLVVWTQDSFKFPLSA